MTVALGDPRRSESLGRYLTVCGKVTGGGSKILPGKVVKITETAGATGGNATIGAAANVKPFGVIPNVYPVNSDSDATCTVARGDGCEIYVEAEGAIEPHARVVCGATGTVKQIAAEADNLVVGTYEGKEGEGGSHGKPITDAAATNVICVRLTE